MRHCLPIAGALAAALLATPAMLRGQDDVTARPAAIVQAERDRHERMTVPVTITDESGEQPIQAEMVWAWVPKKKA